ncbi:Oligopeptide-binding protein AppA precursor [Paracoccus haematequi]|uniref:Oligopeptide-binding protein AppA n=1 Tax=Paracoccus haematequi TaxID=2491866 RepID=A0A447INR3_9RHOB|nr:extracellular solute-binding protein [Paracoccus haematequi]VDS09172.1 Oligopeptide-binding protein AppA precursor [Paracoccus haematequi]
MRRLALIAALALAPASAALSQEAPAAEGGEKVIKTHAIALFGEPALPADFPHYPYVNPDAPKGGEISFGAVGGFDSFNPFTHRGRAIALSVIQLERLMDSPADELGVDYCLLCETLEYPESKDWVIFNLRPEARFSDGTPLTAHDVLFSFETLRDKGLSSFRMAMQQMIAKAEVLDDHRIKFTFAEGYPRRDVISQMGNQIVFSKKDFEENNRDLEQSSNIPFIGSGPYMFDRADMGRTMVVKRNPDYWGKDLPINKGRFNFDRIRYEMFGDFDSAFEAFKAGEYTFRNETSSMHWSTRYDFPALASGAVVREELADGTIATGDGWVFNLRREKFQDIRVREAIGLMFNFEWTNQTLLYGLETRVNSFWDNSEFRADGPPSDAERALLEPVAGDLPDGILTDDAVVQPVSGERQLDRQNMRRAVALLDQAGWTVGSDGMRRNADGQTLTVEILNDDVGNDRIINPFIQNLRAIGIDAMNRRVDNAEMQLRTRSKDFDMVEDSLGQSYAIGGYAGQVFGSEDKDDVFNPMGLANPAIDRLLEIGQQATTQEDNIVAINALDRALRSLRFWVPKWFKAEYTLAYYDIYRHPQAMPPYALGTLDFWWADTAREAELKAKGAIR